MYKTHVESEFYEHRTYQIQAGKAGEFLKIYEAEDLGIITRYTKLIGC
jgi:hypothetical protein